VHVFSPGGPDGVSGPELPIGSEAWAVRGVRRTTLAARLKAIYGTVDKVEAFVGAYSEKHVAGSEMGELNNAMWSKQFAALRDGDRFYYANDPVLTSPAVNAVQTSLGITHKRTLAQLIALNTDVPAADLPVNVFFAP
jgi:Animal haem peroxidase